LRQCIAVHALEFGIDNDHVGALRLYDPECAWTRQYVDDFDVRFPQYLFDLVDKHCVFVNDDDSLLRHRRTYLPQDGCAARAPS
jgi:hypothetical protein